MTEVKVGNVFGERVGIRKILIKLYIVSIWMDILPYYSGRTVSVIFLFSI